MISYYSGSYYLAEVTNSSGEKLSIAIGRHENRNKAFAFAQSRLNWQGYKVNSVTLSPA